MKMNELFHRIMSDLGFKRHELPYKFRERDLNLSLYEKDKRAYFYLSLSKDDQVILDGFLNEVQGEIFELAFKAIEIFANDLSKNSYFVLGLSEELKKMKSNKAIIDLEEDAFFFKKMVIHYDQNEINLLSEKIGSGNTVLALRSLASDQELFEKYVQKVKDQNVGFERLLYQILIKIPSIQINVVGRDFEVLATLLERKITEKDLLAESDSLMSFLGELNGKPVDLKEFKRYVGAE